MNKIEMGKKYKTRSGLSVRILCVDRSHQFPVVALVYDEYEGWETLEAYTAWGRGNDSSDQDSSYDLVEVTLWDHIKIDDQVMVRDDSSHYWTRRYFAGVVDGKPSTFWGGCTSWTSGDAGSLVWTECRHPTPAELKNM